MGSITLERKGGLKVPITLWVRLENREEQRLVWDGQDRWITYEFDSPVAAAVLDPDGNYPMLKDRLHASYTAEARQARLLLLVPDGLGRRGRLAAGVRDRLRASSGAASPMRTALMLP